MLDTLLFRRAHSRLSPLLCAVFIVLLSGCGDCTGTTTNGDLNPGGDAVSDAIDGADVPEVHDGVDPQDTNPVDAHPDPDADQSDSADATDCPPANQCAAQCCAGAELCLRDACVVPGAQCAHNLECAGDEICEPSIGRCIPDPGLVCEYRPETDIFEPTVTVAWNEPQSTVSDSTAGVSNQVMMTPSVIDLNEDDTPEIIFSTFTGGSYNGRGVLRAIDGKTHEPLFDLTAPEKLVSAAASLTVGDIDADGRVEIVAAAWSAQDGQREIIAFDDYTTDWAVLWKTDHNLSVSSGGVALADLDADGQVEAYGSNWVLDARTGELRCRADEVTGGGINAIAADLDADGKMEVITNGGAFKFLPQDGQCPKLWTYASGSGEAAVGDFGTFTGAQSDFGTLDGIPEVVTVNTAAGDQVQLHNGQTGETIWTATVPTTGAETPYTEAQCTRKSGAGAPTIADFDGDGAPEVGAAGACFYAVFETNGTLKWKNATRDFSSRVTGSSVFDFQGDGKAEVVYADECFIRVYDGSGNGDGSTNILFERPHTSGTLRELPVIADVNNNFHANIVVISNDYGGAQGTRCANEWPAFGDASNAEHGILVLEDVEDRWVSTRPVWNQHAYHVTNVCDGRRGSACPGRVNTVGAIPLGELDNWTQPGLNNYRQNVQGEGLFNAPDLAVTNLATDCDTIDGVTFSVTISNLGTRGVPEGTDVALYVSIDGSEQYLTTLTTTVRLLPGGAETLDYLWTEAPDPSGSTITVRSVADADENGNGQHNECKEDNNELQNEATCACQDNSDCNPNEICVNTGECIPREG